MTSDSSEISVLEAKQHRGDPETRPMGFRNLQQHSGKGARSQAGVDRILEDSEVEDVVLTIAIQIAAKVGLHRCEPGKVGLGVHHQDLKVAHGQFATEVQVSENGHGLGKGQPKASPQVQESIDILAGQELGFKRDREIGAQVVAAKLRQRIGDQRCWQRLQLRFQREDGLPERIGLHRR